MLTLLRIPSHFALRALRAPLLLAAAATMLVASPALAQSDRPWLHVHIEDESDETTVEVNLPLAAVEALGDSMADTVVAHANEIAFDSTDDVDIELADLRSLWKALRAEPGAWVQIDEAGTSGLRARLGDEEVRIEGSGEDGSLSVRIPVEVGDALFESEDGTIDLAAAIRSLSDHEGDLVSVTGDDGRVRIWIGPQ